MVGSHCQMLKPYQVAALAYFAALMQRSIRSCVLALDVGLGGHSVVRILNPVHMCFERLGVHCVSLPTFGPGSTPARAPAYCPLCAEYALALN